MIKPPKIAPPILSRPPKIITANTFSPISPIYTLIPLIFPITIPPMTDAMAPKHQAKANTHLTLMPMERAACWSLATALMATPVRENLKIVRNATVPIMAKTNPHKSPEGTTAKPRSRGFGGKISGKVWKAGVHIIYMSPFRIRPRPIVTMITEMIGSPISGLRISRSTKIPRIMAATRVRKRAKEKGALIWVRTVKQTKAPNVMNSPMAKLRTLVAL